MTLRSFGYPRGVAEGLQGVDAGQILAYQAACR